MDADDLMETPDETPRCTAKSKQSGERCRRRPIPGGQVCHVHGGARRATRDAARARLLAAADPVCAELIRLTKHDDPAIRLRSSTAVLDRAGLGTAQVEVTGAGGAPIAVQVRADQVVRVITGVLADLEIDLTERVRQVVVSNLRAMSATSSALRAVPDE